MKKWNCGIRWIDEIVQNEGFLEHFEGRERIRKKSIQLMGLHGFKFEDFTTPLQSSTADPKRIFLQLKSVWGSSRDREHSPRLLGPIGKFEKCRIPGAPRFPNPRSGHFRFCYRLPAKSVLEKVNEKQFWHLWELQSIREMIFVEGNLQRFLLSVIFWARVAGYNLCEILKFEPM